MTFEEATTEICSRVNDPLKDTYGTRSEQYFEQAVCELAVAEGTMQEEIQELLVDIEAFTDDEGNEIGITFSGGEASVDIPYGTLRVLDVYIAPEDLVGTNLVLKAVTHEEVKRIKLEPAFLPAGNECFWFRVGNTIRFLLSSDWEGGDTLKMTVNTIANPDVSSWGAEDLTTVKGYSRAFVFRCIDNAVARLNAEIGGQ